MDYFTFLERRQHMFFGFSGHVKESDLVALAVHEMKDLCGVDGFEISYKKGVWTISSQIDWIDILVGSKTEQYFTEMVIFPQQPNMTFVLGGMLLKHTSQIITYKNKFLDWSGSRNDTECMTGEIEKFLPINKSRVLAFIF